MISTFCEMIQDHADPLVELVSFQNDVVESVRAQNVDSLLSNRELEPLARNLSALIKLL